MKPAKKIWKYQYIDELKNQLKDQVVVLIGGCFDVLHFGHIRFLEAAKEKGDILCVALESDEFIQKSKKRTPVHTQSQRAHLLSALHVVDSVILLPYFNSDEGYSDLVSHIRPAVIAVTEGDAHLEKKHVHANKVGATVEIVLPLISPLSTSHIVHHESFSSSKHTL